VVHASRSGQERSTQSVRNFPLAILKCKRIAGTLDTGLEQALLREVGIADPAVSLLQLL